MTRPKSFILALFLIGTLVISGCAGEPVVVSPATPSAGQPENVALGLGYIPSVQFAPFYVAQEKGFFAEQGLNVEFQHGFETDFLKLVAAGEIPFAVGSGDQVILARAQELPLTYVAAWYRKFPVAVFALQDAGLSQPDALEGRRVGIPGLFGASLVAWKALVYATGLDESTVTLDSIGFSQAAAVSEGRVDAALDYIVNGPVQLRSAGQAVDVIAVSDYIDLPSNGLIASDTLIAERPDLVQKMTSAMLQGIRYTLDNPDEAFDISLKTVPEAGGENEAINRAIFDASLELWKTSPENLGMSDPAAWEEAATFMAEMGLVDRKLPAESLFTNQFAEATHTP
ncbi:MAG: ABC transporter substrate-binding protein [Anaerolineae bacterium]|nr:ABC transporter substrate-binding protein [Anaerolineae bacterium]